MYCSKCGARATGGESRCAQCGTLLVVPPDTVTPGAEGSASATPPAEWTNPAAPSIPSPVAPAWAPARPAPGEQVLYGGFWRRFFSAIVDMLVVVPFSHALLYAFGFDPMAPPDFSFEAIRIQFLLMLLSWAYCAGLESSKWQGSLGQQLLGLKVCDLQGRRIGFGRATVRHFGQILSLCIFGLGYLMILFTSRKQALHDRIAGCLVVRPAPRPVEFVAPSPGGSFHGVSS